MLYALLSLSPVCLLWVCWVRGNFSGGLGHVFSACVTLLCGAPGRYDFIQAIVGADGGTAQMFFLPGSVVAGTVRLKYWGGGPSFFLLSLVCCQFSWRLDVCGRIFCVTYFEVLW